MKKQHDTWKLRLILSILTLATSLATLLLLGYGCVTAEEAQARETELTEEMGSGAGLRQASLQTDDAQGVPFRLFELLDGYSGYQVGVLPESFPREVIDPSEIGCSETYSAQGVVGMACMGDAADVLVRASEALQSRGWILADEGNGASGRTFVKSQGKYRWAFVSCSQVSGSASLWIAYTCDGE